MALSPPWPQPLRCPAVAFAGTGADSLIERTFQAWKAAFHYYNNTPFSEVDDGDVRFLDSVGELEEVIQSATAKTKRGAACQLWIALEHSVTEYDQNAAVLREDIGWLLAREEDFNWNEQLPIAALRSLTAEAEQSSRSHPKPLPLAKD